MQDPRYLELMTLIGNMYPDDVNLILSQYGYPVSLSAALAAGATQTLQLQIQGTSDFLVTGLYVRAGVANAAQTVSTQTAPMVRTLITDAGTNNQFTSGPVDIMNLATNAASAASRSFPWPRLVRGRTTLTITHTSYAAAESYNPLDLFFEGIQILAMPRVAGSVDQRMRWAT